MTRPVIYMLIIAAVVVGAVLLFLLDDTASPGADPALQQTGFPETPRFNPRETLSAFDAEMRSNLRGEGSALWQQYQCVSCHADEGYALKKLQNLGNRYDLDTLSSYLQQPNPPMPRFPLDGGQRRALAVFLIEQYPGRELD